jgi:hypothetical protein
MSNAQLLPAIPGFPETPVTVISEVAGSHDPIRYQIRIDGSGAYTAVPAYRLRFTVRVPRERAMNGEES